MTLTNVLNLTRAYMPISIILLLLSGCAHLGIYWLSLQAVPDEGPAPLTVSFNAEITGGPDTSPELYCQEQTWDLGDGRRVGVYGLCKAWRPGVKIDRHFQLVHTYTKPGIYEVSVSIGPLESEPMLVTVLE